MLVSLLASTRRNEDFAWRHGCVVTAPEQGLWEASGKVDLESVTHMRNRFGKFRVTRTIPKGSLKECRPCPTHMSMWIVSGASEAEVHASLHTPCLPLHSTSALGSVGGFAELTSESSLPTEAARALETELVSLGAAHVCELSTADWQELAAFQSLKKLEQRRLLKNM